MERRTLITSAACAALGLALPRFARAAEGMWCEHARPLMGTFVSIAVHATSRAAGQEMCDECFAHLEHCIAKISNWDERSLTCVANDQGVLKVARESRLFFTLARYAEQIRRISAGYFDPSILALTSLWRAAKADSSVPSALDISHCLKSVRASGFRIGRGQIELIGTSGLEFDGIGKGLIADAGIEYLRARGVRFARIACSGDIRFLGNTEWQVDIEDPRSDGTLGTLSLYGDVAVASSGDYRNCWFVNGERYHHLIDPLTGRPGTACRQATVVARTCVEADALAVALFNLGPQGGPKLLASAPGAAAVVVTQNEKVFLGQAAKFFQPFALT